MTDDGANFQQWEPNGQDQPGLALRKSDSALTCLRLT